MTSLSKSYFFLFRCFESLLCYRIINPLSIFLSFVDFLGKSHRIFFFPWHIVDSNFCSVLLSRSLDFFHFLWHQVICNIYLLPEWCIFPFFFTSFNVSELIMTSSSYTCTNFLFSSCNTIISIILSSPNNILTFT